MKSLTVSIKGKDWKICFCSDKELKKKHPDNNGDKNPAITQGPTRTIDFLRSEFLVHYVYHELFHAFIYELHLDSVTEMTLGDFEEIAASMIGDNIFEIINIGQKIIEFYIKEY